MKRSLIMLLVMSMLVTSVITGCGKKEGNIGQTSSKTEATLENKSSGTAGADESANESFKLRIAWWGSQDRNDKTMNVIEMFKQKYPKAEIETEFAGFGGYWEKIAVQAAGNDLPDVLQSNISTMNQYSSKKQFSDLTSFINDKTIDTSSIDSSIIDSGKANGGTFGISLGTNALGMIYDPDLFKKAGIPVPPESWTWADYEKTVLDMKKALGDGFYGGGQVWETDIYYYLKTFGQKLYNSDGTALGYEDDKYFIDFLNLNLRLLKAKAIPSNEDYGSVKGLEDEFLVRGTSPFVELSCNAIVAMSAAAQKNYKLTFLPSGTVPGLCLKPAMFFSISENSEVKGQSAKFIDFFTNDLEANKVLLAERGVPISNKVKEGLQLYLNSAQKEMFDYVDRVAKISSPLDPSDPVGSDEVMSALSSISEQIYYGKITVEAGAVEFRKQANEILAKNKK